MNLNDYQAFATRTMPEKGSQHWFNLPRNAIGDPNGWGDFVRNIDLVHAVLGISGEAGELVDPVKKAMFYGKPLDVANIREEAGDLLWYIAGTLCRALGCTLEELAQENVDKLRKRYPDKYTDAAAIKRSDKLIDRTSPQLQGKTLRKPNPAERATLAAKYRNLLDFDDGFFWEDETRSWQPAPEMFDDANSSET